MTQVIEIPCHLETQRRVKGLNVMGEYRDNTIPCNVLLHETKVGHSTQISLELLLVFDRHVAAISVIW